MRELLAQGDLLFERVPDLPVTGMVLDAEPDGRLLLAEGELTGHRHMLLGSAAMFRDDSLARDIPGGLYVGHLKVDRAEVHHDEHAPLTLPQGTFRVRRQRQLEPRHAQLIAD